MIFGKELSRTFALYVLIVQPKKSVAATDSTASVIIGTADAAGKRNRIERKAPAFRRGDISET
jgi:hypothetical protein